MTTFTPPIQLTDCEVCGKPSTTYVADLAEKTRPFDDQVYFSAASHHQFCAKHARDSLVYAAGWRTFTEFPMPRADFDKLTFSLEDLNRLVAERVMGWRVKVIVDDFVLVGEREADNGDAESIKFGEWNPATDFEHAHAVELHIRQLNLESDYLMALAEQCKVKPNDARAVFRMVHSTPMERVKAALRMMDKRSPDIVHTRRVTEVMGDGVFA